MSDIKKDVPPVGGELEVLGYVIESEYLASTTYSKGKDPRQEFKRDRRVTERESSRPQSTIVRDVNITELVDRANVTRLQAEYASLLGEYEDVLEKFNDLGAERDAPKAKVGRKVILAVQDICELEPADTNDPESICITASDLGRIISRHFEGVE